MKIKMLATVPASLDGIKPELFQKDSVRDLPDDEKGVDLARNLIKGGLAEEMKEKTEKIASQSKSKKDSDAA
jgi:hypothetical protein